MSSGTLNAATSDTGEGRAFRPGPRTALVAAAVLAVVATTLVLTLSSGGGHAPSQARYGKLPSWLPKISNGAPKLEVARPASPVLSEAQGYTVHAQIPGGSADITAVGPGIPSWVASYVQTGVWPATKAVPASFTVTVAGVKGTVPLSASAFSILNNAGQISHPTVSVVGGGALPAALRSGQHINLEVKARVLEGAGSIRWAPLGSRVLVGWIYQLELD